MFREMRRKKQQLSAAAAEEILLRGSSGILAVLGDENYPYTVPLNYVYRNSKIYFHCSKSGHKIDAIKKNNKVSFCVIDQDVVVPEEYTTYFRSCVAFGRARILEEKNEILSSIELLAKKYYPDDTEQGRSAAISDYYDALCMVEITIDHLTGKEARELVSPKS